LPLPVESPLDPSDSAVDLGVNLEVVLVEGASLDSCELLGVLPSSGRI